MFEPAFPPNMADANSEMVAQIMSRAEFVTGAAVRISCSLMEATTSNEPAHVVEEGVAAVDLLSVMTKYRYSTPDLRRQDHSSEFKNQPTCE